MEIRIKLKRVFKKGNVDFPVGQVLDVDEVTSKTLIETGVAELYDEAAEKQLAALKEAQVKAEKDEIVKVTKEALAEELKNYSTRDGVPIISVHDRSDDDKLGGFKSGGHFLYDIIQAGKKSNPMISETLRKHQTKAEKRFADQKVQRGPVAHINMEADDNQGGWLVPEQIGTLWMPPVLESAIVRGRSMALNMTSNRIGMPALVDSTHQGSYFGGVVIYYPDEAEQKEVSKPHFRKIQLTLHKMAVLVPATDELLEDVPALESYYNQIIPQAIGFEEDDNYINGAGAGMPLGALNAANPARIAVARTGAGLIQGADIANMWSRFKMIDSKSSLWIANHDTFPQLFGLANAFGFPVWLPANQNNILGSYAAAPNGTLMGLPIILTEKCQTLGVSGDIGLIDWSQYYTANKGIKVASSIHLWFDYDMTAFRFVLRNDGQPAWATPLTPAHSANTLSPYVCLT